MTNCQFIAGINIACITLIQYRSIHPAVFDGWVCWEQLLWEVRPHIADGREMMYGCNTWWVILCLMDPMELFFWDCGGVLTLSILDPQGLSHCSTGPFEGFLALGDRPWLSFWLKASWKMDPNRFSPRWSSKLQHLTWIVLTETKLRNRSSPHQVHS